MNTNQNLNDLTFTFLCIFYSLDLSNYFYVGNLPKEKEKAEKEKKDDINCTLPISCLLNYENNN